MYEYLQERGRSVFFAYLVTEDGRVVCDNLTAWREPDDPADPEKDRRAVREQAEHAEGQSWHGPFPGEPKWRGIYCNVRLGPYLMSFGLPDETVYEERTARMYETTFSDILLFTVLTAIKNQTRSGNSPGEVLAKVNNLLCEGNDAEMFVTVWVGLLDLNTGKMRCANAGHEYPLLMRSGGEYEVLKDRHALVLAAMEDIPIRGYEIDLHPGDRLLVYTDGVPESINRQEEQYGLDRMLQKANAMRGASQKETLTALRADLEAFTDGLEQFDDITMLGLTYRGRAEG